MGFFPKDINFCLGKPTYCALVGKSAGGGSVAVAVALVTRDM